MIILAIDASTQTAGAALLSEKYIIAEVGINAREAFPSAPAHSETLLPAVNNLFSFTGLSIADVTVVACVSGPGSFTGLRIGAATAMGIARGANIPLVPVPTLDSLAYNVGNGGVIVPVMDARRRQVYSAVYRRGASGKLERLTDYLAEDIRDVLTHVPEGGATFLGDGADTYREIILEAVPGAAFAPAHLSRCRAASAGMRALDMLAEGFEPVSNFELLYVRKPQAERDRLKKLEAVTHV